MTALNSDPTARTGSASASASTPAPFHQRAMAPTSPAAERDCLEGVRRYQWRSKRHFSDDLQRRSDAVRRAGCPEDVREKWTQVECYAAEHLLPYNAQAWTFGDICATAACLSGSMSHGFEALRQLNAPWSELLHALAGGVGDGRTWRLGQDCDREVAGTVRALLQAVALEPRPQDHPLLRVLLAAFKVGRGAGAVEAAEVFAWANDGTMTYFLPRPVPTARPFTWTPGPPLPIPPPRTTRHFTSPLYDYQLKLMCEEQQRKRRRLDHLLTLEQNHVQRLEEPSAERAATTAAAVPTPPPRPSVLTPTPRGTTRPTPDDALRDYQTQLMYIEGLHQSKRRKVDPLEQNSEHHLDKPSAVPVAASTPSPSIPTAAPRRTGVSIGDLLNPSRDSAEH